MHGLTTFIFVGEIDIQCKFIDLGWSRLQDDVNAGITETWWTVQGILSAAAMLGKLFWGSGGKRIEERSGLRKMLHVSDGSALADPNVRNDFEHYDERLMLYIAQSVEAGNAPDGISLRNIGDRPAFAEVLHHFEPATGVVSFRGHAISLVEIVREARRIQPLIPQGAARIALLQNDG